VWNYPLRFDYLWYFVDECKLLYKLSKKRGIGNEEKIGYINTFSDFEHVEGIFINKILNLLEKSRNEEKRIVIVMVNKD
jgi:hypothetical protein